MKSALHVVVIAVMLFATITAVKPVHAQDIDPCTAHILVEEIKAYLLLQGQPEFFGFSLQNAVELAEGGGLWISTKNVDFDMAFGNVMRGEEEGLPYKLSRYFAGGNGRVEFIDVLKAAGYTEGRINGPTFWGTYQNLWRKKDGWENPCSGSGGTTVPQTTPLFSWINLLYVLLALIATELLSGGRVPVPVRR